MHPRHLRRLGRPDEAQARAGALQSGPRGIFAGPTGRHRLRPTRDKQRNFSRAYAGRGHRAHRGHAGCRGLAVAGAAPVLPAGRPGIGRALRRAGTGPGGHRRAPPDPGERPLLPGHRSRPVRPRGAPAACPRADHRERTALPAGHRGKAVRARSRLGTRAEPRAPASSPGEPDLSDRSLPRQRDGAEPPGLPVLQRHLRADLEPSLRGPRPDHGGRDAGGGGPRRVLRPIGRPARHGAEPHLPAHQPGGHGAAHLVRGRCRPGRAEQGPARGQPDDARAGPGQRRARAIRPRPGRRRPHRRITGARAR